MRTCVSQEDLQSQELVQQQYFVGVSGLVLLILWYIRVGRACHASLPAVFGTPSGARRPGVLRLVFCVFLAMM